MTFEVELKDSKRTITIETDVEIDSLHPGIRTISESLEALNKAISLSTFAATRYPSDPFIYTYEFITKDGRAWNQSISFIGGVYMTFDVPDGWKLEEFLPHRALRDAFVQIVRDFKLEKMEAVYV